LNMKNNIKIFINFIPDSRYKKAVNILPEGKDFLFFITAQQSIVKRDIHRCKLCIKVLNTEKKKYGIKNLISHT